jgi:hypothetical protein
MGIPSLSGEVIDITSLGNDFIYSSQMFKILSGKALKIYWPKNTKNIESNYFLIFFRLCPF